jgi:threonine/homoserine/homoserine lactone efflux protein
MMTTGPRDFDEIERLRIERGFVDRQQDRVAGRGLAYLILLNGVAAIVMMAAFVFGFQPSAEPKLAAAMLVFGSGAVAALVSSFIAYLNRIVRGELPERPRLPKLLRLLGMIAVILSGAAFLSGLAMVGTTSTAKSSSQAKTRLQDKASAQGPAGAQKDTSRVSPGNEQGH